jgi:hypothetical protein
MRVRVSFDLCEPDLIHDAPRDCSDGDRAWIVGERGLTALESGLIPAIGIRVGFRLLRARPP